MKLLMQSMCQDLGVLIIRGLQGGEPCLRIKVWQCGTCECDNVLHGGHDVLIACTFKLGRNFAR